MPGLNDSARSDGPPPIGAHRLIGDGRSAALVRPGGEIDWWCAPDLDSPPLLWSLLDPAGAAARWLDVRQHRAAAIPAGSGTRTVLQGPRGRIECLDGLLRQGSGPPALARLVRGLDADLDATHELTAGGFGEPAGAWRETATGLVTLAGAAQLRVFGASAVVDGRTLRTRVTAPRATWAGLCLSLDPDRAGGPHDWLEEIEGNLADDEEFIRLARLPEVGRSRCGDALRVLRQCTYTASGSVVASVTTSLPEAPGHDRNFDYRYGWLRDGSLAVAIAAQLGRADLAERYLAFVTDTVHARQGPIRPVADLRGADVPPEREAPGISGWAGSTPVRVGNAASDQRQYDALGFLLEAVWVYVQQGAALRPRVWQLVRDIADALAADGLERSTSGIWELREPRNLLSADIGVWLALDRAVRIARLHRPWHRRRRWIAVRDATRDRVLGAMDDDGFLPQAYPDGDPPRADASALLAVIYGLVPARDARAGRLVDSMTERLGVGPFLYRYEPGEDDGFHGTEGAFVPVSWWLISALATVGRVAEARELAERLDRALPALLPEEMDPESGAGLGNVPLVWSHIEAARAMQLIDTAQLRRRYGRAGPLARQARHFLTTRRRARVI